MKGEPMKIAHSPRIYIIVGFGFGPGAVFLGIGTKLIHVSALRFYSLSPEIMAPAPQE